MTAARWFVRGTRAADLPSSAVPVVCLPYAGSGAGAFRGWADVLAPDLDIRALQLPGRESRWGEPAAVDPVAVAQAVTDTLADHAGRYLLYGHSLGARLGYEVVRVLQRQGGPLPRRLVVGGSAPPDLLLDGELRDVSRRPDAELLQRLRRLGGIPQEVLDSPDLLELLLPAIRADFCWIDDYRWVPGPPLPVPVTAVAGRDDGVGLPATACGWARHSAPGFRLRTVPGGHFFLHEQFGALARLLREEALGHAAPTAAVPARTVQLWWGDLATTTAPDDRSAVLGPAEQDRAACFVHERDRARFSARRRWVKQLLALHGHPLPPGPDGTGAVDVPTAPGGRPDPAGTSVSWSHRDGTLLVGLAAPSAAVGVDVERWDGLDRATGGAADTAALAPTVLHPEELRAWRSLPVDRRVPELLRVWVAKEALLKAAGLGLSVEPATVSFQQPDPQDGLVGRSPHRPPLPLRPARCPAGTGLERWSVTVLDLRDGPIGVATTDGVTDWSVDELPRRDLPAATGVRVAREEMPV